MTGQPHLYSIDPENPFYPTVARDVSAVSTNKGIALEDMIIFLPAQRARRALETAFLQQADGKALLLPRVITLGDIADESESLPPPLGPDQPIDMVAPVTRQARLATMIHQRAGHFFAPDALPTLAQCWHLSKNLSDLVDDFDAAGVTLQSLRHLLPDSHAQHWQQALALLTLILQDWPKERALLGGVDTEQARSITLQRMADHFLSRAGQDALFIAGTTGSRPSVRRFVARLVSQAGARLYLPGVDMDMPEATEHLLGPDHPQWLMVQLLKEIGASPSDCKPLGAAVALNRVSLFRDALAPREMTASWFHQPYGDMAPDLLFQNCRLAEAPGRREEAAAIAIALREVLETEGRTGLLVTPDRALADQVRFHLRRWGIQIDDAGGQSLKADPLGRFLLALIVFMTEPFSALNLLSLLLNPITRLGRARAEMRQLSRLMDKHVLRGPRFSGDFSDLKDRAKDGLRPEDYALIAALLDDIRDVQNTFMSTPSAPVQRWLTVHLRAAIRFMEGPEDDEEGLHPDSLNRPEISNLFQDFHKGLRGDTVADGPSYAALFDQVISGKTVRKPIWNDRRIAILGPMEIRSEQADLVILGGLNEGSWPGVLDVDPWLNKAMRQSLKLPPLDQRIGQAAHDFITAAAAPEVLLTRAKKGDGSPTVAARWLYRIAALARQEIPRADDLLSLVDQMDMSLGPDGPALDARHHWTLPPTPKPPLAARPTRLSVSDIQRWMRDPYSLYARKILRLTKLDPLDADPSHADKGTVLHLALETFLAEKGPVIGPLGYQRLLDHGHRAFKAFKGQVAVEAFWWPRFENLARAFVSNCEAWFQNHQIAGLEVKGRYPLPGTGFTVEARADRIDRHQEGQLVIIDYKTGGVPSPKEILAGYAPQLPLEGLIAEAGGFEGIAGAEVGSLSFWLTKGGKKPLAFDPIEQKRDCDLRQILADTRDGIIRLVTRFQDPDTPYLSQPRPALFPFSDYDHLARVKEWRGLDLKKEGDRS